MKSLQNPDNISSGSNRKRSRINRERMKQLNWQRAVTLGASVLGISACSDGRQDVYVATDPYSCAERSGMTFERCELAYRKALNEAAQSAPRYKNREECEQEFGFSNCEPESMSSSGSSGGSGGGGYGGGGSGGYRGDGAYHSGGTNPEPPRYYPRMTGFVMDGKNPGATQAYNPVFTHTDQKGNMRLVTADAEPLESGKNGMMRANPQQVHTPAASGGKQTLSRGGFGSRMAMKMSFGG